MNAGYLLLHRLLLYRVRDCMFEGGLGKVLINLVLKRGRVDRYRIAIGSLRGEKNIIVTEFDTRSTVSYAASKR